MSRRADRRGPFVVEVAALRRAPGTSRKVVFAAPLEGLSSSGAQVPAGEPVQVDLRLESVNEGIVVRGKVRVGYVGQCRRCLEALSGEAEAEILELCVERPDDEMTYPLDHDLLDLEPIVHDACILEMPLAPLCREDCLGLCPECGTNVNHGPCSCRPQTDDRWAALAVLSEEGTRRPASK